MTWQLCVGTPQNCWSWSLFDATEELLHDCSWVSLCPRVCATLETKRALNLLKPKKTFRSVNILIKITQSVPKCEGMVSLMRQEKEWIVRGGREGGRALCVYGEHSQQHRLTGNVVFFACWAVPLVQVWQGGRWMCRAHRLRPFYYHISPIVWGCLP